MTSRWWGPSRSGLRSSFPVLTGITLPSNSVAPAISPAGPVAIGTQLTLSQGTWSNASTFIYNWSQNGVPVGTNSPNFTPTIAGATIAGSVTANGTITASASNTVSVQGLLVDLALTSYAVTENATAGTVIGAVLNKTPGSTLGFTDDAGGRVAWSGTNLVATSTVINYDQTGPSLSFIPNETLAGMSNSPHDTNGLALTVINQNDTNPDAFTLGSVSNVTISTPNTASMTISGLGPIDQVTASVSGDASRQIRRTRGGVAGSWSAGPITGCVNGDVIEVQLTSSASFNTQNSLTLSVGTTSATYTVTTMLDPAAPPDATLTLLSAPGASLVLRYDDPLRGQGQLIQWEFTNTQTPTFNADGSFSSPISQSGIDFVDGESYANLQETMGYAVPFGNFSVHMRPLIDDDFGTTSVVDPKSGLSYTYTAGPWTNVISGNIQISVANLATTPNNKSAYITLSNNNLSAYHNNNVGAPSYVRATIPAQSDKFDFAIRYDDWFTNGSTGSKVGFAMSDLSMDLDSPGYFISGFPGQTSTSPLGFHVELQGGSGNCTFYINGATTSIPFGVVAVSGDYLVCQVDKSNILTPVIKFWFVDVSAGTTTLVKTINMTSRIPATNAWYFMTMLYRGQFNSPHDANTWFPDASAIRAHDAGFTVYG